MCELAMQRKPHLLSILIFKTCVVWTANPSLAVPYFENGMFQRLILYKEERLDDHNTAYVDDSLGGGAIIPTRIMILQFLETVCKSDNTEIWSALKPHLQNLTVDLVQLNLRKVRVGWNPLRSFDF
jgi:hypothetical protein